MDIEIIIFGVLFYVNHGLVRVVLAICKAAKREERKPHVFFLTKFVVLHSVPPWHLACNLSEKKENEKHGKLRISKGNSVAQ